MTVLFLSFCSKSKPSSGTWDVWSFTWARWELPRWTDSSWNVLFGISVLHFGGSAVKGCWRLRVSMPRLTRSLSTAATLTPSLRDHNTGSDSQFFDSNNLTFQKEKRNTTFIALAEGLDKEINTIFISVCCGWSRRFFWYVILSHLLVTRLAHWQMETQNASQTVHSHCANYQTTTQSKVHVVVRN